MARNASQRHISGVAKTSAFGATVIMALAMATSYGTQVELLHEYHVGWASWAIPLTIDVLALMSNLALTLPRRADYGRGGLWAILIVTLSVSTVANFAAGANFTASTAHAWVVIAYLTSEYVRNWVRSYRAAVETEIEVAETAAQATVTEVKASDAEAEDLPEAPVSPGVPATRKPYGPRDLERGYAPSTVRAKKAAARKAAKPAE